MAVRQSRDREARAGRCSASRCYSFARDSVEGQPGRRSSRWTSGMATPAARQRLYTRLTRRRRRTRSCCPATCTALRRRSEAGLHRSAVGDRRHRVHEHVDHDQAATARTSAATGKRCETDNPHIKYHSARRGYIACTATPSHDARRLQDPRQGERARSARAHRRIAGRPGGTAGKQYGLSSG